MSLVDQLAADLIAAMKAKDAVRTSALRMLKAAISNAEIEARGKGKTLDDAAVLVAVKGHAKKLAEAVEEFRNGGRKEMATATAVELRIVERYLPAAMPEAEVRKVVATVRAKTGMSAMGPLMGAVMKELAGKADGTVVRKLVEEVLKK